jgi:hypothetical protein
MSELDAFTLRATELSSKADFWNNAVLWALALTALAAVAIVVSQRLAFVRAKQLGEVQEKIASIKEAGANAEQQRIGTELAAAVARAKEGDARIAEAQRGSIEANARASKAQESLALAEQHSAEANAKAEGFRLDIAKANESAKQAEARAAEANLELARFKAPRTLSPSEQATIVARLRPLGMRHVDVIIIGDPPEITDFTVSIVLAVRQAGWTTKPAMKAIAGPSISGVLVGTRIGSDRATVQAADALISALQSAGRACGRIPQFGDELPMAIMGDWDARNIAAIRILVGAKP